MSLPRLYPRILAHPPAMFSQDSASCPRCLKSYTMMQLWEGNYHCQDVNCTAGGWHHSTARLIPRRREFRTLAGVQEYIWEQEPSLQDGQPRNTDGLVDAALEELENQARTQGPQSAAGAGVGNSTGTSSHPRYDSSPSTIYAPPSFTYQLPAFSTSYGAQGSMNSSVEGGRSGYGPQPDFQSQYSSSETQSQYQYGPQTQDHPSTYESAPSTYESAPSTYESAPSTSLDASQEVEEKSAPPPVVYEKPYSGRGRSGRQRKEEKCHFCWRFSHHCDQLIPKCSHCVTSRSICKSRDPDDPPKERIRNKSTRDFT